VETNENNNRRGPYIIHSIEGEPIDFAIRAEEHTSSMWFGGDDGVLTRNVGAGQSITPVHDAKVDRIGFNIVRRFDYAYNPTGVGHAVSLILRGRRSDGSLVSSNQINLPASFNGGWVMFTFQNLWLDAGETYTFACHVKDGEISELNSDIYGHNANPWPTSQGYYASVSGSPADMDDWANWKTHSWDFNFRMEGRYMEPYPGDINDDRVVNVGDIQLLADYWLASDCIMPGWCDQSDINWDSSVQLQDFSTIGKYWGATYFGHDGYDYLNRDTIAWLDGTMSTANIYGSDGMEFKPGTYFIYKTDIGRYGKFIVEGLDTADNNKLTIGWVTYRSNGTVLSSGTGLVIRGTWHCGLDTGVESPSSGSDFWWYMLSSTVRYLHPENGAKFRLMYLAP
ncbi:MAG: hypothetical protein KAS23_17560, partial [Anaerohalosphaera sp.]|nr:hypothetical protein [Anaerohalosphaera sp.]